MAYGQRQTYRTEPAGGWGYRPPLAPSTEGVLTRRLFAYLVDLVIISLLVGLFGFLVFVAGIVTFGLGWTLYGILVPATAILYSGLTVGGPRGGTVGMRMFDLLAANASDGGPVGFAAACVHAVLFYLAAGTMLIVVDVLIGLARPDRRLGHDLLSGIVLVRRAGSR